MTASEYCGLVRLSGLGSMLLTAGTTLRIGLISLGEVPPDDDPATPEDPSATSRFDYFRVYHP